LLLPMKLPSKHCSHGTVTTDKLEIKRSAIFWKMEFSSTRLPGAAELPGFMMKDISSFVQRASSRKSKKRTLDLSLKRPRFEISIKGRNKMDKYIAYSRSVPGDSYAAEVRDYLATVEGKQGLMKVGLAEELWRAMERSSMTKAELARRAGVTPQYISKIFKGTTNFTFETIVVLFHLLGHEFSYHVTPLPGTPDKLVAFVPQQSELLPPDLEGFKPILVEKKAKEGRDDSSVAA
jgi:transcriptional regulator with XRE-family HTH domain